MPFEDLGALERDQGAGDGLIAEIRLPLVVQIHRRGVRIALESPGDRTGRRAAPTAVADRVLRTVLVTDLVDSTKQAAAAGDDCWSALMDEHDALVRDQLDRFAGREVNTRGDGFLAVFDGPCRAIRCARAISDGVHDLGLRTRAGIHSGEIERRGPDVAGLAVLIGARVASLANADEVLVSSSVPPLVLGTDLAFEDRGEHELKGVPGRWHVFAVC